MPLTSFSRLISQLAKADPDCLAVTCGDHTITRQRLDSNSNRLARAYLQRGVKAGDFVTIALPNSIEFFEASIALWKIGATPQPVSAKLPKKELQAIIGLAQPRLILGVEQELFKQHQILPVGFTPESTLSDEPLTDITTRYWKAPTSGGSTGRPKLIVSEVPGELDPESESPFKQLANRVVLISGPLYHNGPFLWAMEGLMRGNHVVVMPKFDALRCLQLIEEYRVDWVFLVPTMMHRIWRLEQQERERYDLSSLRIVLHSAAPCPEWLKEAWINWLDPETIHELYGGTEGSGTTWISGEEWLSHKGSVGKLLPGSQVKVVDPQGQSVAEGQMGELYFLPDTGQGSTYHYIGAEPTVLAGGWESLGDMGYIDKEGYLYLSDRKKDLIISGGANIYPAEVEAAIESHPAVRSCLVLGLPDDDLGQQVHAMVDAPGGLTQEALCQYLAGQLVRYKIPRSAEFVDAPLRDDAGKARRSALVEERQLAAAKRE